MAHMITLAAPCLEKIHDNIAYSLSEVKHVLRESYTVYLSNIIAEKYYGTPKLLGTTNLQYILVNIVAQFVVIKAVILEITFSCQKAEPCFNINMCISIENSIVDKPSATPDP